MLFRWCCCCICSPSLRCEWMCGFWIFSSVSVLCFRFHGNVLNSHSRLPFQKYRILGYRHNSSRFFCSECLFFSSSSTSQANNIHKYFRMNSIEDFRLMSRCHCYRCSVLLLIFFIFYSCALCRVHFTLAFECSINVTWWLRFVCHSIKIAWQKTHRQFIIFLRMLDK